MDRYEYELKLEQMRALASARDYEGAAKVADTINWRKVKSIHLLMKAGDIYTRVQRYEEAKEILLLAYDRSPIGRMIVYRLACLAVRMRNFEEAEEYYDEFCEVAPRDTLKYVLRYKISKAKGTDPKLLINILEELRTVEYTEEWAYELASLYYATKQYDKCAECCDELILWFGEGNYVKKALELKARFQTLTKEQQEKYEEYYLQDKKKQARKDRRTQVNETIRVSDTSPKQEGIEIPEVEENIDRFSTINLQREIAKSMDQIREAKEKETVTETMDNIKKLVENNPYLQMPKEPVETANHEKIYTDEEIDGSLRLNFNEILAEESQELADPEREARQITGQLSIDDILQEWERTKQAAESAMMIAEQQKLDSAKARALQEAEDIMDQLSDVIPKLMSGEAIASGVLHAMEASEEQTAENVSGTAEKLPEDYMKEVNDLVQKEIDQIQKEIDSLPTAQNGSKEQESEEDEKEHALFRKIKLAKPNYDEQIGLRPYIPRQLEEPQSETVGDGVLPQFDEEPVVSENPVIDAKVEGDQVAVNVEAYQASREVAEHVSEELEEEPFDELDGEEERWIEPEELRERLRGENEDGLPQVEIPVDVEEDILKRDTKEMKVEVIEEVLEQLKENGQEENVLPQAPVSEEVTPMDMAEEKRKLSEEQLEQFSYFIPVSGMEQQISKALAGMLKRLRTTDQSSWGNLLIQGGPGSGKSMLATNMIKTLQQMCEKPNGKVGKIDASALNQKSISNLLEKVQGGTLIIEHAGLMTKDTAKDLSALLEKEKSGLLVIMEDTRLGLEKAMGYVPSLNQKFTEKIVIPVFTIDELVNFAKAYANDNEYDIDEMGVLALYNRISNIQRLDQPTTLTEVKEIVDEAIEKAERKSLKKTLAMLTSRRYSDNDFVLLKEKDFEN